MSELNEEEIIGRLHGLLATTFHYSGHTETGVFWEHSIYFPKDEKFYAEAIQGLLDLYQKEKQKNKILDNMLLVNKEQYEFIKNKDNYISKDKIRNKIKELEKQEDWYIEHKSLDDLYEIIKTLQKLLD